MAKMAPDCTICQNLWKPLVDRAAKQEVNFGSFEDVQSSKCSIHTPLVKAFVDHCLEVEKRGDRLSSIRDAFDIGIRAGGSKDCSPSLTESIKHLGRFWDLLLVQNDSIPNSPGTARILDPDWVDLEILKKWKHECFVSHGLKCKNPMKSWPARPAWLIDVENQCIVPGSTVGDYLALSYRWGDSSDITRHILSIETPEKLMESRSLLNPEISLQIAPIVRHAMFLTSTIGENYLWVDTVCIDHGNRESTRDQLNMMGAIYASAIVTIVAADTGYQDGLLGLKGISNPRGLKQKIIPFGDDTIVVRNTGIFDMETGTPYYERGWAYQEYKMAQRKILFNQQELHWQCQCSVWHEELVLGAECDKYIDPRLTVVLAGFPDLGSLNHCLTD